MTEQKWECERCGKDGVVTFEGHAGVVSVIYLIEDDHKRVSPECTQSVEQIKAPQTVLINVSEL